MTSEYTVFDGITVIAYGAAQLGGRDLGPAVVVTCPDREWDPMTIARPFATFDEARTHARELAASLSACCPKGYAGFLASPRLASRKPEMVAARAATEMMARTWAGAGADAVIHSLNH